jgi:hypothetical protein
MLRRAKEMGVLSAKEKPELIPQAREYRIV